MLNRNYSLLFCWAPAYDQPCDISFTLSFLSPLDLFGNDSVKETLVAGRLVCSPRQIFSIGSFSFISFSNHSVASPRENEPAQLYESGKELPVM